MMETESVTLEFTNDAIQEIANLAADVNQTVENIGARRLHTIIEKLMKDISFTAPEMVGKSITISHKEVSEKVSNLAHNTDLSKFIL